MLESCLIGMKSCASAHYWARWLEALGHEVKLIPAQYVKVCVRGNKNDDNDAPAISEAFTQPQRRFVLSTKNLPTTEAEKPIGRRSGPCPRKATKNNL